MTSREVRHALEHAAFRMASGLVRALPERVADAVGAGLGWMAGSVLRIRRRDVDAHLRWAFPDATHAWRAGVARRSYAHLGREAVALFRLSGLAPDDVLARTTVTGLEQFREALGAGQGLVLVTGHLGNWEIGGAALAARGVPVDAVAKRMANRRFDRDLVAAREALGMRVIDMAEAPHRTLRGLREGRVAALVADQNAGLGGLFVPFFGKPASTARGPALFALRSGAPLFLGVCLREPGAPARYGVTLLAVAAPAGGAPEDPLVRLTTAHVRALEAAVRNAPEQYFWQHRRWKTRPPEEPPSEAPV